eukprot:TRINITY_DN5641_c0_g1_i2.p1 TRINITY_DN5641_c0_g1~~TRINITY_DN5641_c0_g1_i2.p1  ORF type:complete len:278 (+),score=47.01 TRINITY_DN5641_c0_g1_i2:208-1041(+)
MDPTQSLNDLQAPMLSSDVDTTWSEGLPPATQQPSTKRTTRTRSLTLPELARQIFDEDEDEEYELGDEDPDVACKLLSDNQFRKRLKHHKVTGVGSAVSLSELGKSDPGISTEDPGLIEYPCLEAGGDEPGESGVGATIMTFLKCFLGTGVLFLPDGFRSAGIIPASTMLIGSGALATYCMLLLLETKKTLRQQTGITPQSYGEIAEMAGGKLGKRLVDSAIIASQCGFCAVYVAFIGSNMSKVASFGLGKDSWTAHFIWMSLAQCMFFVLVWVINH